MPRKEQGWITFQTSEAERQILEEFCEQSQRTKTEILRELVRNLSPVGAATPLPAEPNTPQSQKSPAKSKPATGKRSLKVSSRNVLKGRVTRVVTGAVNSEITLEIEQNVQLISIITRVSAEELGLVEGAEAYAVIKSSDVVIAME